MVRSRNLKSLVKVIMFFLVTFSPLIAIIWYSYAKPMYFMDAEYAHWKQIKDFISSSSKNDPDVLFIGDSCGNTFFVPQIFGKNFYNIALTGATPVEMYYMMQTYLENHTAPKVVFFGFRNKHFTLQNQFWLRTMYFNYFSIWQEIDFFFKVASLDKSNYEMENWFVKWMQYRFHWPTKYLPALNNSGFYKRKNSNENRYKIGLENRGRSYLIGNFIESSNKLADDCYYEHFQPCEINEVYLHLLINLLKEKDIKVVIEQFPFNVESFQKISDTVKQEEEDFYKNLQIKFGILANSQLFCYDDYCFSDEHHSNYRGASKYSYYICEKYSDILAEFRMDKEARYNEILEYVKTMIKTENGVLETLNNDLFALRVYRKNNLPEESIQNKIFSEMKNVEFVLSSESFDSPIETKNFLIDVKKN